MSASSKTISRSVFTRSSRRQVPLHTTAQSSPRAPMLGSNCQAPGHHKQGAGRRRVSFTTEECVQRVAISLTKLVTVRWETRGLPCGILVKPSTQDLVPSTRLCDHRRRPGLRWTFGADRLAVASANWSDQHTDLGGLCCGFALSESFVRLVGDQFSTAVWRTFSASSLCLSCSERPLRLLSSSRSCCRCATVSSCNL